MPRRSFLVVSLLVAGAMCWPAIGRAQSPSAERTRILQLASTGKATDAWVAWNALPAGPDKVRLGIDVAIAARDLARGLDLYRQLPPGADAAANMGSLRNLALATAAELARDRDQDSAIDACSAALRIQPLHQPCRELLEGLASRSANVGQQALGAYALADAGLRPFPGLFTTLEQTLSASAKRSFATRFTHLPARDRVSLLRSSLSNADAPTQYQVILALGDIAGADAEAAIRAIDTNSPPVRMARTVALAQHGDKPSLEALTGKLDSLDDFLKIPASLALALTGDAQAAGTLDGLLRSPVDLQRIYAADAATRVNPMAGHETILNALASGSPAARGLALAAAGRAGLGTSEAVYSRLAGSDPELRARAVGAIADTLSAPPLPPVQETAPPRLLP